MALRDAVLAALLDGEASGYDLAKRFDASVANYWMATPQQLYRELERMAADGLVEARLVTQERRPNKRLFSLTDEGRAALYRFSTEPHRPPAMRDELVIKVDVVDVGNVQAVRDSLAERMQWSTAKLDRYERRRARLLDGRSEKQYLAEADRIGPYLTLLRGISFEQENVRWIKHALSAIDRRLLAGQAAADE